MYIVPLACVLEALSDRSYGASLYESDQGFVYIRTYDTEKEYNAALADEIEAEDN